MTFKDTIEDLTMDAHGIYRVERELQEEEATTKHALQTRVARHYQRHSRASRFILIHTIDVRR